MRRFAGCEWFLLLCGVNAASCLVSVHGVAGQSVLLPCLHRDVDPSSSVYWRDKDDRVVMDILKGAEKKQTQDQIFRGRADSFPDRYREGNFSVVLRDVRPGDAGTYECHIPAVDFQQNVRLNVSGKPVVTAPPPSGGNNRPNAAAPLSPRLPALLAAFVALALLGETAPNWF